MRQPVILLFTFIPSMLSAQFLKDKQSGNFSLGTRAAFSAFSHGDNELGYGAGSHFRIQLTERVNTEWFMDIISGNIDNKAQRMDYHIGWSVMYYVIDPQEFNRKVTPFVVAGHCFDYTRLSVNTGFASVSSAARKARFNSAVQAGGGFHYNITPRFDLSPALQYMMHFGKGLSTDMQENSVTIETHKHAWWEGHLLVNISVSYKFIKLWNRKKHS